ncbi:peptidase family M50 [Anaerotignum neopropionicum]|uniref:Peptidase family M50 n=1 Tax=Anaerotignum neopropionicum TaxID=36847 RepID=A0A136WDG8_9FIRM|nr:site-2 protease family protein [Anaerotignum neopropionicum]KXL52565.1 peptidase family M50 [Anaerotignum neopropionicum]
MNYFWIFLVSIPGIIFATTIHEFTRAAVSTALGDTLPQNKGRLTLNPMKHFEPIGFLIMFYSGGFGWGRPVETSALYYKNRKRDTLLVAVLPSVVNMFFGIIFLGIYSKAALGNTYLYMIFNYLCYYNVGLAIYNILPVSPMDCVKVLSVTLPANKYFQYLQYEKMVQMLFLFLLFFGLITGVFSYIIHFVINFLGLIFVIL